MRKRSWTAVASIVFAQIVSGLAVTHLPSLAENDTPSRYAIAPQTSQPTNPHLSQAWSDGKLNSLTPSPSPSPPLLTQQPATTTPQNLGEELLQQVLQCVLEKVPKTPGAQLPSMESLEGVSTQCVFKIVMLAPDGSLRPDASERLTALVKTTGVTLPKPSSQGQATVQLQKLPDTQVFTVPVTIGGQSRTFLLDTGASNSIVESQIAQQLGLKGTPIPKEMLEYMVVGDNCADVKAMVHNLPTLTVDAAKVEGIMGLGLPKTAIIGNLPGVLGLDFLSGYDVILNPKTMKLQLLPPSTNSSADAIPLKGRLGVMTAQVQINGQGPFTFLVDTGAEVMVLSEDLAKRLSIDVAKATETEVRGFCGTEKGKQIKLAQVSLQQHQAKNLDTVILGKGVLDLLGVDGIVGQNFLNQYQQHWRFGKLNELSFPDEGSLVLSPL